VVRLFIAITDQDWFEALAAAPPKLLRVAEPPGDRSGRHADSFLLAARKPIMLSTKSAVESLPSTQPKM
jgi:hypothetical protein